MAILGMIDKGLTAFLRVIMGITSIIIFVVTFAAVVFRYVLAAPLPWSQDVIRLAFTYMIYFGAAYCMKENAHLSIDVVISLFNAKLRKGIDIAIYLVLLAFFLFMVVYGIEFAQTGSGQTTSYLMIPMSYYYAGVPLAGGMMAFYTFEKLIGQIFGIKEEGGEQ